ncbi:doublesex- and mab-3-related transcription factor A2 [Phocoena sinus]|uniref:doublesex- and mab-3-related transcription factor A2 n=1 Tax=Phocoena sinus TaxID=42100 RepID=UPI0013C4E24D|nr:doublesex- and mab-3-related transcription factor A2 [Phocoena sinus]
MLSRQPPRDLPHLSRSSLLTCPECYTACRRCPRTRGRAGAGVPCGAGGGPLTSGVLEQRARKWPGKPQPGRRRHLKTTRNLGAPAAHGAQGRRENPERSISRAGAALGASPLARMLSRVAAASRKLSAAVAAAVRPEGGRGAAGAFGSVEPGARCERARGPTSAGWAAGGAQPPGGRSGRRGA